MGSPKYVAIADHTDPLTGLFSSPTGALYELDVHENRIVYRHSVSGALKEVAKLAEELNSAQERDVEAIKVNEGPNPDAPEIISDGVPTVSETARQAPSLRPGWEPLWILQELTHSLQLVDSGKINLPAFKARIRAIEEQMMEDIPK